MSDIVERLRQQATVEAKKFGDARDIQIEWRAADEIERLRAQIERLTRERDEARYFLKIFVHAHASNNAVPPHLEEQAREALEGKP